MRYNGNITHCQPRVHPPLPEPVHNCSHHRDARVAPFARHAHHRPHRVPRSQAIDADFRELLVGFSATAIRSQPIASIRSRLRVAARVFTTAPTASPVCSPSTLVDSSNRFCLCQPRRARRFTVRRLTLSCTQFARSDAPPTPIKANNPEAESQS